MSEEKKPLLTSAGGGKMYCLPESTSDSVAFCRTHIFTKISITVNERDKTAFKKLNTKLSTQKGVLKVQLNYDKCEVLVSFDQEVTDVKLICSEVEGTGLVIKKLYIEGENNMENMESSVKTCHLKIDNMTCSSCVNGLEKRIKELEGVKHAQVSLLPQGQALVIYDSNLIDATAIANSFKRTKFSATLLDSRDKANLQLKILNTPPGFSAEELALAIGTMRGTQSVDISLKEKTIKLCYEKLIVKGLQLYEHIIELGYEVEVLTEAEAAEELLSNREEQMKWRKAFMLSTFFSIPCMIIMTYVIYITHESDDKKLCCLFPGASLQNLMMMFFSTGVIVFGGKAILGEGLKGLKQCTMDMNVLISITTLTSYVYSMVILIYHIVMQLNISPHTFFDTPPMLITFITLGRWLECIAKGKTSEAISKLIQLKPAETIYVLIDEHKNIIKEKLISTELIEEGVIVKVLPGANVPVDGEVIKGNSSCDESFLTGESMPVVKTEGSVVYGGTVNLNGLMLIKATSTGKTTALSQIVKLVKDAQLTKPAIQRFADKIAGVFIPLILVLCVSTFLIWTVIGLIQMPLIPAEKGELELNGRVQTVLKYSFQFALSVLAIACPCALGLATPTAIMVATGTAALNGIVIKGARAFELANKTTTVALDKTGTITHGKPSVSKVAVFIGQDECKLDKLLLILGLAEKNSEHPVGSALVKYVQEIFGTEDLPGNSSDFEYSAGLGIRTMIRIDSTASEQFSNFEDNLRCSDYEDVSHQLNGSQIEYYSLVNPQILDNHQYDVVMGNREWLKHNDVVLSTEVDKLISNNELLGETAIICSINGIVIAIVNVTDSIKAEAALAIHLLKQRGLEVILLTGDTKEAACAVAQKVFINQVWCQVLPADKLKIVKELQRKGKKVVMIGDGINDSPALAQSEIGVAIGAGTDVAIDAADVVLIKSNLLDVIAFLQLSKKTINRIHLNFLLASVYNMSSIPIAAGIFSHFGIILQPWMAAAAMALSSVSVVFSSLFLKQFKKTTQASLETEEYHSAMKQPCGPIIPHIGSREISITEEEKEVPITQDMLQMVHVE